MPMSEIQRITVLGSTGSIGKNTLDVVSLHPERYQIFALSAHAQVEALAAQCLAHSPKYAVMTFPDQAQALKSILDDAGSKTVVLQGESSLIDICQDPDVDMVMAAIVGAAGLPPCLAAARAGKRLLLANKEALVVGARVFLEAVERGHATLIPIDSEHSAIFQCLPQDRASWHDAVEHLILTASGGPFRTRPVESLQEVTPEQACAHPNWVMGRKISVDSATMMNKALEVIEAHYLFGFAPDRIQVLLHPQSVIHSMVQFKDQSVMAQLGTPDMKMPIALGLSWPERIESGAQALNFSSLSALTFETLDQSNHSQRFAGLALSWQALAGPVGTTAILNAANEVAVAAFLEGRLRFDRIAALNAQALSSIQAKGISNLDDLLDLDGRVRRWSEDLVKAWS